MAKTIVQKPPFKCRFCSAKLRSKFEPEAEGWDWITGYLPNTEHCCPACLIRNRAIWNVVIELSCVQKKEGSESNG